MSSPFGEITCDSCDFHSSTLVARERFFYVVGNGSHADDRVCRVRTCLGWCFSCGKIFPIEALADVTALERQLVTLQNEVSAIDNMGFWETWRMGRSAKKGRAGMLRVEISELEAELSILKRRQSSPRCTQCGDQDNEVIPKLDRWWEVAPGSLKFKHPGCGGIFMVEESQVWISVVQKVRHLNAEGRVVGVYDDDW